MTDPEFRSDTKSQAKRLSHLPVHSTTDHGDISQYGPGLLSVGAAPKGRSIEEILADYPYLEREDVLQALRYAAWLAEERQSDIANA